MSTLNVRKLSVAIAFSTVLLGTESYAATLFSAAGTASTTETNISSPLTIVSNRFETQQGGTGAQAQLLASSQAQIGSLSASSFVRASQNSVNGTPFSVFSSASWKDAVTIGALPSNFALNGQSGVLTGRLLLDGILETTGPASRATASVGFGFLGTNASQTRLTSLPGSNWVSTSLFESGSSGSARRTFPDPFGRDGSLLLVEFNGQSSSPPTILFTVPFVVGQAFDFGVGVTTSARIETNGNPNQALIANSNFSSTLNWGGIASVTVNGQSLTDYVVTTGSGVDLRGPIAPIPEASSVAMFGFGLIAVVLIARRKKVARLAGNHTPTRRLP
jgi:hypothetical protein